MTILIILLLIFLLYYIFNPCRYSFTSKTGTLYKARNSEVADVLEELVVISNDLVNKLNEEDSKKLEIKLQNTSFVELINEEDDILAWNYDKGREIGIKIYDTGNVKFNADTIITSLLHELAHSLCDEVGHEEEWIDKNNYLQSFKYGYIDHLIKSTFIKE
jgi:hypothetical protein